MSELSYQVLARKWRPKNFTEVIGQEHILRTLINALKQNRLHHAYLLTGTRGVGKTTLGRILAKCFNCETGLSAEPCGQCDTCLAIDAGKFIDLIEVDAASRTKVEDTRELLNNVQYAPSMGRYKIYLIDEVHMLSGHSFNALLKTLEEPPPHVKFLLATTDPQRLPITILSRCLQLHLKNVPLETIAAHLQQILKQESIPSEPAALLELARAAQGSVRDALSLLDQAIAYGAGKITSNEVHSMLGTVAQQKIIDLLSALAKNDAVLLFSTCQELSALAVDFNNVLDEILTMLQRIALKKMLPDLAEPNWENFATIAAFANQFQTEDLQLLYQIALIGKRDLSLAPTQRSGFEMVMLRMLAFVPDNSSIATTVKTNTQVTTKNNEPEKPKLTAITDTANSHSTVQPSLSNSTATTVPGQDNWLEILNNLKVSGTTQALVRHCSIGAISDNQIELLLEPSQAPMLNKKHEERLSQALSESLQKQVKILINIGKKKMETLASKAEHVSKTKQAAAENVINQDPQVKTLLEVFDATIVPDSVQSNE
jgi:DNA polymerase III subunit gamma/tau